MLIAIDIGNSSINIGYFMESGLLVQKIATHPMKTADAYYQYMIDFLDQNHVEKRSFRCIISSVVTSHTAVLRDAVETLSGLTETEISVLSHEMNTGLDIRLRNPEELGTDRLASAAAAHLKYQGPVAVIDFGTATTVSVVGRNSDFIGGAIMPGIGLMNDLLDQKTSQLKKVTLSHPMPALGRDTAESICSGLLIGTAGGVERILAEIEQEIGYPLQVVITGGYAPLMDECLTRPHEMDPLLLLEGLKEIYERNR